MYFLISKWVNKVCCCCCCCCCCVVVVVVVVVAIKKSDSTQTKAGYSVTRPPNEINE